MVKQFVCCYTNGDRVTLPAPDAGYAIKVGKAYASLHHLVLVSVTEKEST